MVNRAVTGKGAQVGEILPGAVGRDIPRTGWSARGAHPLITRPPFTLLTVNPGGGRGTRLETELLVKPTQTLEKSGGYAHEAVSP